MEKRKRHGDESTAEVQKVTAEGALTYCRQNSIQFPIAYDQQQEDLRIVQMLLDVRQKGLPVDSAFKAHPVLMHVQAGKSYYVQINEAIEGYLASLNGK